MTWSSGRGRPPAVPCDTTPLRGPAIDARARVSWLVRVHKLARGRRPANRFVQDLAARGCVVGATALSRYETGREAIPRSVLLAYEQVLDLPPGQLVGAATALDQFFGGALAPSPRPVLGRAEVSETLGTFERLIAAESMTGLDWIRVAEMLTGPNGTLIPPSMLRTWVRQLADETIRALHHAHTTRRQAIALLAMDPVASTTVLEVVDELVRVPGVPPLTGVIAALGSSQVPDVLEWLVAQFAHPTDQTVRGAAFGLLHPIVRGTLPADLVPAVRKAILAAGVDGQERGAPAFLLAQRMSPQLTQQVVALLGRYPARVARGARIESPAELSRYRAAALEESGLDDRMLDRLLREALSPDFMERQHYSSMLLSFSPYRRVLARVAADLVAGSRGGCAARSAADLLPHLAGPQMRGDLVTLLQARSAHRTQVLKALVRSGGVPDHVDLVRFALEGTDPLGVAHAAGMSNHPDLACLATQRQFAGTDVQRTARWWVSRGAAVTDESHVAGPYAAPEAQVPPAAG